MGEGTGEEKIRREDGDGKVRLGECQADQEVQRFRNRSRWTFSFFLCLRQTAFLRATGETTAEIKHKNFVGCVEYRA